MTPAAARARLGRTAILFLAGLAATSAPWSEAPAGEEPVEVDATTIPPGTIQRIAAPGPLDWEPLEASMFVCYPGRIWAVSVQETTPGTVRTDRGDQPLRETRVRIRLDDGNGGTDLGYVQHLDNRTVALLDPDDPRVEAGATLRRDPDDPWPNTCGVGIRDTGFPVDLDNDGRNELVLRYYATAGGPDAEGLLLVEEGKDGRPRIVPMSDFVGTVRLDDAVLTDIERSRTAHMTTLTADFRPLTGCRFIAQLGIRGEAACKDCCQMPVILHPDEQGIFHPIYDRPLQRPLLDRVRDDLQLVASGGPDEPLSSAEQAALARAAAFFYLTGSGRGTREQLMKALGARAERADSQLLLDRIENYFLLDAG